MEADIFNGCVLKDLESTDDSEAIIYLPDDENSDNSDEFLDAHEFSELLENENKRKLLLNDHDHSNQNSPLTEEKDVYDELDKIVNEVCAKNKTNANQNNSVPSTQELVFSSNENSSASSLNGTQPIVKENGKAMNGHSIIDEITLHSEDFEDDFTYEPKSKIPKISSELKIQEIPETLFELVEEATEPDKLDEDKQESSEKTSTKTENLATVTDDEPKAKSVSSSSPSGPTSGLGSSIDNEDGDISDADSEKTVIFDLEIYEKFVSNKKLDKELITIESEEMAVDFPEQINGKTSDAILPATEPNTGNTIETVANDVEASVSGISAIPYETEKKVDEDIAEIVENFDLNESFLDEHSYFNSQTIDLVSDDDTDTELFNEIRGKVSTNDNAANSVSKFSKILLESFDCKNKQLTRFLLSLAEKYQPGHEENELSEQFQILEEDAPAGPSNIIIDSEIIDVDAMEFEKISNVGTLVEVKDEIFEPPAATETVENSFENISFKVEVESEQIMEPMSIIMNESVEPMDTSDNLESEKIDESMIKEGTELSQAIDDIIPDCLIDQFSDETSNENKNKTEEKIEEGSVKSPQKDSDKKIESKSRLNKVKEFGENLLEEIKSTNEKLEEDDVDINEFIKNSFWKFRELLVEMNLKKHKKRDIEKIKNQLVASGSESSDSEASSKHSESENENVFISFDREMQTVEPKRPKSTGIDKKKESVEGMETENLIPKRKTPDSEISSQTGEESESDISNSDDEINRLTDLTSLDKLNTIKGSNKYSTIQKKKKKKKKELDELEKLLNESIKEDSSNSESESSDEPTEEQFLNQQNENIRASLFKDTSESEDADSESGDIDDLEISDYNSSNSDSFMEKIKKLDEENIENSKGISRGKEIYERSDEEEDEEKSSKSDVDDDDERAAEFVDSDEDGKNKEKDKNKSKENEINNETEKTDKDKNDKKAEETDKEEPSIETENEPKKKSKPKLDAIDKELFDKNLLKDSSDSDDEASQKSKEKAKKKPTEKKETSNDSKKSDEIVDVSMFEKKRTHRISTLEEYFAKRETPSTSSAPPARPASKYVVPEEEAISLSSDSEDEESVSSATPSASSSATNHMKRGRRSMLTHDELAEETKKAQKDEENRMKRLEIKTEMMTQVLNDSQELLSQEGSSIVLDYDNKKKRPITVHPKLVELLKPHQVEGVKFMYDTCFGSINDVPAYEGSGCILAHCMGLGKTLQLITLLHTVIRHPQLQVYRVLVICPKSTVMNWKDEITTWLRSIKDGPKLKVFHLKDQDDIKSKVATLEEWYRSNKYSAGCFLIGYEAFKTLVVYNGSTRKAVPLPEAQIDRYKDSIRKCLLDGPQLVVCDEGHTIKNAKSMTNQAVVKIKTRRRIVLTGTPIQNNLSEYFNMIDFVKPSYLGTEKEFNNLYHNPIKNGQHKDSSKHDIKVMKQRSYVLHKKLSKFIQRKEAAILKEFLPEKYEYCLFIPLTPIQEKLYKYFLENNPLKELHGGKSLLPDYTFLRKIWTHPKVLESAWYKARQQKQKKMKALEVYNSDNDEGDEIYDTQGGELSVTNDWWRSHIETTDLHALTPSNKLIVMFEILKMCQENNEKCLVFSAFVTVLNVVEYFMKQISEQSSNPNADAYGFSRFKGPWVLGRDYLRLDGKTSKTRRHEMVQRFNDPNDKQMRCFLISSKAGGQGINLFGANRCIILDTSWNPASDQQNIFRIYRLGQTKQCYVYRLLAMGTMEEKVYSRSVTKQAMSFRVVDKQQVDRHYSMAELTELYKLTMPDCTNRPTPHLPQDEILRRLLKNFPDKVFKYHEHDSLLENKLDEELSEAEKQEAWKLYESDEQSAKLPKVYNNNVYSHFNDFTNPLFNDLGFGLAQMAQLQMMQPNAYTFPNMSNFDPSIYNSLYRSSTYGKSLLSDADMTSLYSSLLQANSTSLASTSTTNQMLRHQLNSAMSVGPLGYLPVPTTSISPAPLSPSTSLTMSGGGIIGASRIRSDMILPNQPSTSNSSLRSLASISNSLTSRPDVPTNFGINNVSLARKEVPSNSFHPSNNPLLSSNSNTAGAENLTVSNGNRKTNETSSSNSELQVSCSRTSPPINLTSSKSNKDVRDKQSVSNSPPATIQVIRREPLNVIRPGPGVVVKPPKSTISSTSTISSNLNSMPSTLGIARSDQKTVQSSAKISAQKIIPKPINLSNIDTAQKQKTVIISPPSAAQSTDSIITQNKNSGIVISNVSFGSSTAQLTQEKTTPQKQTQSQSQKQFQQKQPQQQQAPQQQSPQPQPKQQKQPQQQLQLQQQKPKPKYNLHVGPKLQQLVQQQQKQPQKLQLTVPADPKKNVNSSTNPKRIVLTASPLRNGPTILNGGGSKSINLQNRPQLKIVPVPSTSTASVSTANKPSTITSTARSVEEVAMLMKAFKNQMPKKVSTNPNTSGNILVAGTSNRVIGQMNVPNITKPGIDINKLSKNSAITISEVKKPTNTNMTIQQSPSSTSGASLKRAIENAAVSVTPTKKQRVLYTTANVARRPNGPPGPPLEMIEID